MADETTPGDDISAVLAAIRARVSEEEQRIRREQEVPVAAPSEDPPLRLVTPAEPEPTPAEDEPLILTAPAPDEEPLVLSEAAPLRLDTPAPAEPEPEPLILTSPAPEDAPLVLDAPVSAEQEPQDAPLILSDPAEDAPLRLETPVQDTDAPLVLDTPAMGEPEEEPLILTAPAAPPEEPLLLETPADEPLILSAAERSGPEAAAEVDDRFAQDEGEDASWTEDWAPAPAPEADELPPPSAGLALDDPALRALIADVVRAEFQGELGQALSANIHALIRAELVSIAGRAGD